MSRVVERATLVGFGACLVLLGTVGASGFVLARRSAAAMADVERAHRVIHGFDALLLRVTGIETGQRGYVITGDVQYLEPYRRAAASLEAELAELRQATRDSAADHALVVSLEPMARRRLALAREIVDARTTDGFAAAQHLVMQGETLALTESIRDLVGGMRRLEESGLEAHQRAHAAAVRRTIVVFVAGSMLSILVAASAFAAVRTGARRLRDAEERSRRLAAIVEGAHDAVYSTDLDGEVVTWNASAERLYGYLAEEAIGQRLTHLAPPGREPEMALLLERTRRGEHVEHFDTQRVRKDGTRVNVSLTLSPLLDDDERTVGASVIVRDVTRRKLEEAEREGLIHGLQEALAQVKTLRGMLPICAWCKSIRDDKGYWSRVEAYLGRHSDAEFTHGICPPCLEAEKAGAVAAQR